MSEDRDWENTKWNTPWFRNTWPEERDIKPLSPPGWVWAIGYLALLVVVARLF